MNPFGQYSRLELSDHLIGDIDGYDFPTTANIGDGRSGNHGHVRPLAGFEGADGVAPFYDRSWTARGETNDIDIAEAISVRFVRDLGDL